MSQSAQPDAASAAKPGDTRTSIDPGEIAKFQAMAAEWWDPNGKFKPLHRFNPTRLRFIRERACTHFSREPTLRKPLEGLRAIDIGCGGGLVSEPIARLGASVTGIDAGEKNIKTAMTHAESVGLKIDYRISTVEELVAANEQKFDLVLTLEVVEHVADPASFLKSCAALLKPGGLLVMATINRTPKALAFAIVAAEQVLRWLPPGTHQYEKLVTPREATEALQSAGLGVQGPFGVSYNPLFDRWSVSNDSDINYMLTATNSH
jgi:2-polyprenyl-6-hydroxyphenyl methylase / 3-demethylubiquinone-9 3-methyltransferase